MFKQKCKLLLIYPHIPIRPLKCKYKQLFPLCQAFFYLLPSSLSIRLRQAASVWLDKRNEEADERDRTSDPRFTKALLYQLSYIGIFPIYVAACPGVGKYITHTTAKIAY